MVVGATRFSAAREHIHSRWMFAALELNNRRDQVKYSPSPRNRPAPSVIVQAAH